MLIAPSMFRSGHDSISGYHIREAGSTAVQELASLCQMQLRMFRRQLTRSRCRRFCTTFKFFWNGHNNFFEERQVSSQSTNVARDHVEAIWCQEPSQFADAVSHTNGWLNAYGTTAAEQHSASCGAKYGCSLGWHTEFAYQWL